MDAPNGYEWSQAELAHSALQPAPTLGRHHRPNLHRIVYGLYCSPSVESYRRVGMQQLRKRIHDSIRWNLPADGEADLSRYALHDLTKLGVAHSIYPAPMLIVGRNNRISAQ